MQMLCTSVFGADKVLDASQIDKTPVSLTEYFAVLEDPGLALTLADVQKADISGHFKTGQPAAWSLKLGMSTSAYWLRLRLRNASNQPIERMLEMSYPRLAASVRLHQPIGGGGYSTIDTGYLMPFADRPYRHRFYVLPVSIPAHTDHVIYLRLQSPTKLEIPAQLWTRAAFHEYERVDYLTQAFYFGMVLAMVAFNLLLFVTLRDVNYLLYVAFVSSIALTIASESGLANEFLWGNSPGWASIASMVGYCISVFFLLLFVRRFISTETLVPRLDKLLKLATNLLLFLPIGLAISYPHFLLPAQLSLGLTVLLLLVTGVVCALQRNRGAFFLLAAFAVFGLAALATVMRYLAVLPSNSLTIYGMQFGSALEMLLLAFALADRYNVLRQEKAHAQAEALLAEQRVVETLRSSEKLLEGRVREIEQLAFYDQLTGLPNRRLMLDRLEQALTRSTRSGVPGALLLIDMDNFKDLNDTRGHYLGDMLLQQVALRLVTCVREVDCVARLGGDEFVVILQDLSENAQEAAAQGKNVGEEILSACNEPYQLDSYTHRSSLSIGVALFASHQGTIDDLLKRADLAMYQAKAAGRNNLRFFNPEMQAVATTRTALEADLHEAIEKNQFLLHYQAQVLGDGHVTGAEVLVRWTHPQRGMVSPAEFIPLAEGSGLILPIGRWVLEAACLQLNIWAARAEMAHLTVAVNVSARQLHQDDFVAQVLAILDHTGANPQRLTLELTESLLMNDIEDIISKMTALKARGVRFSLDDFGTGYSSLSYLKRLPLDQLKIDQVFVRDILVDPNDAAIAKMIIALAQSVGLTVTAEGVETSAQRDYLKDAGCLSYQGYFFSPPLPLDGFEEFARGI